MRFRRSSKVLLPLIFIVVAVWILSNIWTVLGAIDLILVRSTIEFNSGSGVLKLSLMTQTRIGSHVFVFGRGNDEFQPFRTGLLPRVEHLRFPMATGGFSHTYEMEMPYRYLLNALVLVWLLLWWWRRRRGAKAAIGANPQAA